MSAPLRCRFSIAFPGALTCALLLAACSSDTASDGANPYAGLRTVSSATDRATSSVDGSGAVVRVSGGAEVIVPRGAVATQVEISVSATDTGYSALGVEDAVQVIEFLPHGTTFQVPVTVRVPYSEASGEELVLYTSQPEGPWTEVGGASFSGGYASAQVTHFSFFFAHSELDDEQLNPTAPGAQDGAGGAANSGSAGSGGAGSGGGSTGSDTGGGAGQGSGGSDTGGGAGQGSGGSTGSDTGGSAGQGSGESSGGSAGESSGGGASGVGADAGAPDAGATGDSGDAGVADPCAGIEPFSVDGDVDLSDPSALDAARCATEITGSLSVQQACGPSEVWFPRLGRVGGSIAFYYSGIQSLRLPELSEIGGGMLYLVDNGALSQLDLSSLAQIGGALVLMGNTSLPRLALSSLQSVAGDVMVSGNCNLSELLMPVLSTVGGKWNVAQQPLLESVDVHQLDVVKGDFTLSQNPLLSSLDASALSEVGETATAATTLKVFSTGLTALSLPSLSVSWGDVSMKGNCSLAALSMSSVDAVLGESVTVSGNEILPQGDLDALSTRLTEIQFFGTRDLATGTCAAVAGPSCVPLDNGCGAL